jgi:SAM-dependent methyltransferase
MSAGAAEAKIVRGDHYGPKVASAKGYDIVDCATCGFRHVVPLPSESELTDAYRQDYYASEKPAFLAHAVEDQAWAELSQIDRLELIEQILPAGRRRLLDIGSGPGFFLKTASTRGWSVLGVEPSAQASAHARELGVEVVESFFDDAMASRLGKFDAVHLNNVLEHVPDPISILIRARDLLEPGGALCVGVPNDFSPFQIAASSVAGTGQWWLAPPHHLNYFDFDSLHALLERLGFFIEQRMTSFPMEMFLLMGEDYTRDPSIGRNCHSRRKNIDLALERAGLRKTRRAFYSALADAGLGREAVIVATRR